MPGEKFTLMQYSVNAILGLIEANDFVIPEIQRPFVWKRSQVRDLIDSLYHGYPTGYIITWKNPSVRTKDGGYSQGKKVLIDGQQRITALMAAISGKEVLDEDFKKDRIKIAFNPLAADDSKRFAVQDASHLKDKKWIPDISVLFSANFKPRAFENEYAKNNPNVDLDELADEISKLTGIANRQIGVIELDHSLDIDEVTEIFIRINSKGTALSQSDFVMSKMAADTDHDGPENVDRIPGILDRRAEADDRQRADHTERQSDVVPDDDHDRCGDERQHRERYVKLHAVYAAAVRKTVGQENKARDHCSDRHAEHDGLSCQLAAACL